MKKSFSGFTFSKALSLAKVKLYSCKATLESPMCVLKTGRGNFKTLLAFILLLFISLLGKTGQIFSQSSGAIELLENFVLTTQFGDKITIEDMNKSVRSSPTCNCLNGSGIFELTFQDVCDNRNYGFDDLTDGLRRQEVVCKVFRDLSALLNSGLPDDFVRIEIPYSKGNGISLPGSAILAEATPVIYTGGFDNGIESNMVMRAIQSGEDPYDGFDLVGFLPGSYHGVIRFNFEDFNFFLNDINPLANLVGTNLHDLYTVTLHESFHLLGFYSLINGFSGTKESRLANVGSPNCYSKWDTHLRTLGGSTLTSLGIPEYLIYPSTAPYQVEIAATPSFQQSSACLANVELYGPNVGTQDLYRPFPWNHSGVSHLNCGTGVPGAPGCAINNGYVMNACGPAETAQRHPHENEVKILCDLGYQITGQYGETSYASPDQYTPYEVYSGCSSSICQAVGVNDVFSVPVVTGENILVPSAVFLGNDVNSTGYVPNSFEMMQYTNFTLGTVSDIGNGLGFSFTAGIYPGLWAIFRYLPICSDGSVGDWAYVFIQITAPDLDQLPCPINDDCNLVCNGDFEGLTQEQSAAFNNFQIAMGDPSTDFAPSTILDGIAGNWSDFCQNVVPQENGTTAAHNYTSPNGSFAGIENEPGGNYEGLQMRLREPLELGQFYEVSFYLLAGCEERVLNFSFNDERPCPSIENIGLKDLIMGVVNEVECSSYTFSLGQVIPVDFGITDDNNDGELEWKKHTRVFQATGEYKNLFIYPDEPSARRYFLIDDIEVIPVEENSLNIIAEIQNQPCSGDYVDIKYTVCSETDPGELIIDASLPPFLASYGPGGDFTNGVVTLSNYTFQDGQYCTNITLNVKIPDGLPEGTEIDVNLNVDGACIADINDANVTLVIEDVIDAGFSFEIDNPCDTKVTFFPNEFSEDNHHWQFGNPLFTESFLSQPVIDFLNPGVYQVNHEVSSSCGTESEGGLVLVPACANCNDCDGNITIGTPNQSLSLSEVIQLGLLPATSASGLTRCIQGTLIFGVGDNYKFENCNLRMGEGAKILIKSNGAVEFNHTTLHGCDKMWRGVEVEAGGNLSILNLSLIQDAQYAVYLDSGALSQVRILGSYFYKNFVGIFKQPGYSPLQFLCSGNTFDGGENNLLSPYSGQSSTPEQFPDQQTAAWSGIWIEDASPLYLFGNHFKNLTTGLVFLNTAFQAINNRFVNVVNNYDQYPLTNFPHLQNISGCGIYGEGDGSQTMIVGRNPQFENCRAGIRLKRARMQVFTNWMQSVVEGIILESVNSGGLVCDANEIKYSQFGLTVRSNEPTARIRITNNQIVGGTAEFNFALGLFALTGDENLQQFIVKDNKIGFHYGNGMIVQACREGLFNNNEINLYTPIAGTGIELLGSQDCLFLENTIVGVTTGGGENTGLRIYSSPGNVYCCNTINKTRLGVQILGPSQTENNFRKTSFQNHAFGLKLENSAILGEQFHTENKWLNTNMQVGAFYDVTPFDVILSRFTVDPSDPSNIPANVIPSNWFVFESDPNEASLECSINDCAISDTPFSPDSPDTKRITTGGVTIGPFPATSQWELERYIFRKLKGRTISDPDVQAFFNASTSNSIDDFQEVEDDLLAIFNTVASYSNQLSANNSQIEMMLEDINEIDSSLVVNGWTQLASVWSSRQTIEQNMKTISENSTLVNQNKWVAVAAEATIVETDNNLIPTQSIFDTNLKAVDETWIHFLLNEMEGFDQTDQDTLESIAQQCALEGGLPVFKARALQSLATGQYVDRFTVEDCSSVKRDLPPNWKLDPVTTVSTQEFQVYPNPVKNELNIKLAAGFEDGLNVSLFSVDGKIIKSTEFESFQPLFKMDVSEVPSGLYFLHLKLGELEVVRKVVIE